MERLLVLVPRRIVDAHLSVDDIAAMIEGRLPSSRRAAVEAHLAECAECRAEFVDASTVVSSAPEKSASRMRWVPVAAAAAVVIAAMPIILSRRGSAARDSERSATPAATSITTLTPAVDSRSSSDSVVFAWHAIPGVATYNVFVTDSAGALVYSTKTADTLITPAATLRLSPGSQYYWYVDALRSDGSSISSPPISFSIRNR